MKTIYILLILSFNLFANDSLFYFNLRKQAQNESLLPIRNHIENQQYFWNEKSTRFIFAPSFNNKNSSWVVPNSKHFKYSAFSFEDKKEYTFIAKSQFENLSPIWNEIPAGLIYLKVEAVSDDEKSYNLAGSKMFYKSESFTPPYPKNKYSYEVAIKKGLEFQKNQTHLQNWLKEKKPDHKNHQLYCYSALEVGSVVNSMILYNKYFPKEKSAIEIAKNAADYLIKNSEPKGSPLEFFPQVYEGVELSANRFKEEIIMTEPSSTGISFLNLYEITKDKKYFEAAINIANTYKKTQLQNGTWYIRIKKNNGALATEEFCIPIRIVNFLDIFVNKYKMNQFKTTIDKAINWIWSNPMTTYNWTGQFEDVEAQKPYANLTKYEASWFAQYLFLNFSKDSTNIKKAKELVAFCEDQFVVWQNPKFYDNWGNSSESWRTPSVLEQYSCYVPIDASSVQMAETFLIAYKTTNEKIYFEKAIALINSIVNAQETNGRIPTFWANGFSEFWNNCMVSDLQILDKVIESGMNNSCDQ